MSEHGPVVHHLQSLAKNLQAGARLALFLPLRAASYRVSAADFATLLVFNFLVWIGAAAVRAGFAGEFDVASISVFASEVTLTLAAALLASAAFRATQLLLALAIALSASDLVFEIAGLAAPFLAASYPRLAFFGLFAWLWIVTVRAVAVVCGTRRPQFLIGTGVVTAALAIGFFAFPRTEVWLPPEEEAGPEPLAQESVFHRQGELIEQALAAIAPGRPGRTDLYFVGFAPDASEEVFLKEVRYVRRLFDERFGTAGRSIVLASSATALEELPIGSTTNLARALARVGERMNPDEDVLFLFVTAHGGRDHRLSADQPPLELNPLTPTALSRMLQDAGIKWRVLVVSACYAGGFIEPLRDANTVVIAAAAPDRASFGCEAGREFTYFGQAYFRDALARTRSFTRAFDLAKEIVAKEEAAENLVPSQPQIWVGEAIGARLDQLAERPEQ
jgi:hypothetical protein